MLVETQDNLRKTKKFPLAPWGYKGELPRGDRESTRALPGEVERGSEVQASP